MNQVFACVDGSRVTESVCDAAFNGQQAVNMIKNDVEINGYCCYQLIIIDQNMPV